MFDSVQNVTYICVYICVCVYIYIYVCVCVCVCVHTAQNLIEVGMCIL